MMNEFLELEFWRIISVRVEDTLVVVELWWWSSRTWQSWRTFLGGVLSSYARMSFGDLSNCDKIRNSLRARVLEDNQRKSGGYSGGRRGSLVHKSCAKRILYLVVAMVVVEQDMAVVENLSRWSS
ncbi:hypothetical protein GOBAR_AA10661 [Gossypium barbadense]|uniref:Uncharacterized protein n=1 Tax=Gossypium barbadense TaxID=3634 RepID=A0A2P5Y311_GOSBA|nr:hypothetical protein GOBAR_AA10661 [Gossypium barbadense]